jgi:hypothetical protein
MVMSRIYYCYLTAVFYHHGQNNIWPKILSVNYKIGMSTFLEW